MKTNDGIIANGSFQLSVFENGKLVSTISENNLVVTTGQKNVARGLCGDTFYKPITQIGVGTGVISPVLSDTALTAPVFTKALVGATYPEDNSVMFSFDIL